MATAALVIAAKLALGLVVEGQVSCPTPALVAAEAAPLLPEDFGEADARLRLTQVDGWGGGEPKTWIRLELFDASGELVASRQVRGGGNCSVLAHRIAVVAAAWQAELSDEPPMVPPEALATPEAAASAWPSSPAQASGRARRCAKEPGSGGMASRCRWSRSRAGRGSRTPEGERRTGRRIASQGHRQSG